MDAPEWTIFIWPLTQLHIALLRPADGLDHGRGQLGLQLVEAAFKALDCRGICAACINLRAEVHDDLPGLTNRCSPRQHNLAALKVRTAVEN